MLTNAVDMLTKSFLPTFSVEMIFPFILKTWKKNELLTKWRKTLSSIIQSKFGGKILKSKCTGNF